MMLLRLLRSGARLSGTSCSKPRAVSSHAPPLNDTFAPAPSHGQCMEPRKVLSQALVVQAREVTPTVRELTLDVVDPEFEFVPGNWVDFFIDGIDQVGGYSICSTPQELPVLRLAIKRSNWPPAEWCHSVQAGARVQVMGGGKFGCDVAAQGESLKHVLLVAGGIGITPLYSIVQALVAAPDSEVPNLKCISIVHSAKTVSELAYREELEAIAEYDPRVQLFFRATHKTNQHGLNVLISSSSDVPEGVSAGRVNKQLLTEVLEHSGVSGQETTTFVCGPPIMTDHMVEMLEGKLGVENVRFERWW